LQTSSENVCGAFLSSTIVPTTPSERSQHTWPFHHHCSSQNRARTFLFYISSIFVARQKRNEEKKETFELRNDVRFLSSTIVPTTPSERSQRHKLCFHHHCSSQNRARTFFFYISRIFVAIDTKTKRKKKL